MKVDFLRRKRNIIIILIILFVAYLISPLLSTSSYVVCQIPPPAGCQLSYGFDVKISIEAIDRNARNICGDEFFTSHTSTCNVKVNEPFILTVSNEGGYYPGGCFLSSINYDNGSIQEIEPLYWYGPFSLFSGHSVYHRFVAKEPGESIMYTLGGCNYFGRYRIVAG